MIGGWDDGVRGEDDWGGWAGGVGGEDVESKLYLTVVVIHYILCQHQENRLQQHQTGHSAGRKPQE